MQARRPFTDPLSVGLAGLTLLALAAASFTSALTKQLRLPRAIDTATVIVMPAAERPPPAALPGLARLEPSAAAPAKPKAAPRRAPEPVPAEAPPQLAPASPPAPSTAEVAEDAAATGATQPAVAEPAPQPSSDEPPS